MAQADEALLRLCRLCVAIKLHTQNMSIDEATKFFQDNCYYEEKPARQEAMRGTFDPGYFNYTLGKLQILKLRDDYKAQQGNDFGYAVAAVITPGVNNTAKTKQRNDGNQNDSR